MAAVLISAPNPDWPRQFAAERARLATLPFAAIEHIGSTAIPGLRAKPVIDIMALVASLPAAPMAALAALGYGMHAAGMTDRQFLRKPGYHLHIVAITGWATRKERLLRDHLLAHPEAATLYAAEKDRLAAAFPDDPEGYTKAKTPMIQSLMNAAFDARGLPRLNVWTDAPLPSAHEDPAADAHSLNSLSRETGQTQ